jgi:hypothetical protein
MPSVVDKVRGYREVLRGLDDPWEFVLRESNLPGPRANLELVAALGEELEPDRAAAWASVGPAEAGGNDPAVVAVVGAIVALGRLVAEGDRRWLAELRRLAGDPRWRVREGVAMGLQRIGSVDVEGLLGSVEPWADDPDPLVQRAVAAGLCEPALLTGGVPARAVTLLDRITRSFRARADRRSEGAVALRKGLGYCWSVAIAADPAAGIPVFERWFGDDDRDIRWIVHTNLSKARLARADPAWHAAAVQRVGPAVARER